MSSRSFNNGSGGRDNRPRRASSVAPYSRGQNLQAPRPYRDNGYDNDYNPYSQRRYDPHDGPITSSSSNNHSDQKTSFTFQDAIDYKNKTLRSKVWYDSTKAQDRILGLLTSYIRGELRHNPYLKVLEITDSDLRDSKIADLPSDYYPILRYRASFVTKWLLQNNWKYKWVENKLVLTFEEKSKKRKRGNANSDDDSLAEDGDDDNLGQGRHTEVRRSNSDDESRHEDDRNDDDDNNDVLN